MEQRSRIKGFLALTLVVFLYACGGDNNEPSTNDNGKDRKEVLTNWADNIIIPSYTSFRSKFDGMKTAAEAFKSSPSGTNLAIFRSRWVDAYKEWQRVELFEFGPADKYTLRNFFNIYPTDVAGITSNINDPASNLEVPASYARQGFPALDYLLNGVAADDAAILTFYTDANDGAKRLAYIERVVDHMNTLIQNVITEWPSYRETFISKTGLDIGSSFGLVVNAYVLNYERFIRSGKFGIPSGSTVATGGVPFPEKVEAFYKKDISKELAEIAHQASYDFFLGRHFGSSEEGLSMKSYLDALDAKDASSGTMLSQIIETEFTNINAKFGGLQNNLSQQIQTDNSAMVDMYANMQKLVRLMKVDMTSAMSITITYTDNDGD